MKIPTNMHLLIFLAVCVLFTTTMCATSIQNCPGGSLDVVQNTEGVLNCVGYSVSPIIWEFKSGQSAFYTIGRCTESNTCTLKSMFDGIFTLASTSGTSSDLTLTTTFTAGLKTATFYCDRVECVVNIVELATTPPPTTTPPTTPGGTSIQNCPGGSLDVAQNTVGVLNCVGYSVSPITWEFKSGQSSFSTIGRCDSSSACYLEATYGGIFTLTPTSGTSSDLTLTTTFTAGLKSATFACDGVNCLVSIVDPATTPPPTTTPDPATTPPPTTTPDKDTGNGQSAGEIAGIVIGCFFCY